MLKRSAVGAPNAFALDRAKAAPGRQNILSSRGHDSTRLNGSHF